MAQTTNSPVNTLYPTLLILGPNMEPFLSSFLYSTVFHQVSKPKNSRCQFRDPLTAAGAVALRANRLSPNG